MKHCIRCQLSSLACVCEHLPALHSELNVHLLFHSLELAKPSNSGRLISLTVLLTSSSVWQRGEKLEFPAETALVFPEDFSNPDTPSVDLESLPKNLLLLDATWQQARKMYRQSRELQRMPIVSLPNRQSQYVLRRNQKGLSTAEAVVELLRLKNEEFNADSLEEAFLLFQTHYQASQSGHAPHTSQ